MSEDRDGGVRASGGRMKVESLRPSLSQKAASPLFVTPVDTGSLRLDAELAEGRLLVRLKGNADSTTKDAIAAFLEKIHAEALRLGVPEIRADFTELYFMTSSCIKCFVTWITWIREAPIGKRYPVNFVVNPNLRWQKRNMDVLLRLSPELLSLTEARG